MLWIVLQIIAVLSMVIGWAGLPDDLAKWRELINMLLDRSWLSWLFMIVGFLLFVACYWRFLVRQTQGFLGHASALVSMTQTDFMVDAQYVLIRGLFIVWLPLIVMGVVFDIMAPPIVFLVCGLVFSIGLYVRRLGVTGRHQEQQEVITILRGLAGIFATMLVIGVMVVVTLELLDVFKTLFHQQIEIFHKNE